MEEKFRETSERERDSLGKQAKEKELVEGVVTVC